jgi:hypothetical protein
MMENAQQVPPRPNSMLASVKEAAAERLATLCADWSHDGTTATEWKTCLLDAGLHKNGYEIAKSLDDYHSVEPDGELIEILDRSRRFLQDALDEEIKKWVSEHQIKPSFAIGDRVQCRYGNGVISAISYDLALYLVIPDGQTDRFKNGGGYQVRFEAAKAETTTPAQAA